MSTPAFTLPSSITRPIGDLKSSNYSYVSAITILLYDYLLTFQQERVTVWRSDWTVGKVLFLINRYVNIFVVSFEAVTFVAPHPNINLCRVWWGIQSNVGICLLGVVEAVLVLRTYALYGKNKYVGIFFTLLASVTLIYMLAINNYIYSMMSFRKNPLPSVLTGCQPSVLCVSSQCFALFPYYWIPMFICDSALCAFTGYRAYKQARNVHRHRLLTVVLRDGIMYFAFILAVTFTNLVLWASARHELMQVLTALTRVLVSVLCSRLLLNIRRVSSAQAGIDSSNSNRDRPRAGGVSGPNQHNLDIDHLSNTTSGQSSYRGDRDIGLEDIKSPRSPGWPASPLNERASTPSMGLKATSDSKWDMGKLRSGFGAFPTKNSMRISGSNSRPDSSMSTSPVVVGVRMYTHTHVNVDSVSSRDTPIGERRHDTKGSGAMFQDTIAMNDFRDVSRPGALSSVGKVVRNGVERTLVIETKQGV